MSDVKCPQCGAPMVGSTTPTEAALTRVMVQQGSSAPYAANFAAAVNEKRERLGAVYTCSHCRYVTRVKDAA